MNPVWFYTKNKNTTTKHQLVNYLYFTSTNLYGEILIRNLKFNKWIFLVQCSVQSSVVTEKARRRWEKAICNMLPSPFSSCALLKRPASLTNTISKLGVIVSPALKDFLSENQPLLWFYGFLSVLNPSFFLNNFLSAGNILYLCMFVYIQKWCAVLFLDQMKI